LTLSCNGLGNMLPYALYLFHNFLTQYYLLMLILQ